LFEALKKRFIIELILVAPDLYKKVRTEVDTSDYMTREVLSIEYEDERWKPKMKDGNQ